MATVNKYSNLRLILKQSNDLQKSVTLMLNNAITRKKSSLKRALTCNVVDGPALVVREESWWEGGGTFL